MHIPDGYLSPQTYTAAYLVAVPFWAAAVRNLNKTLKTKNVPKLALGAAFSFVIMMFNIPIVGGTTGHAVGSVLIAIMLGPHAACIAVTIALAIQAILFGDGGITCFGANCLSMAIAMPYIGYAVYKLIAGVSDIKSKRHVVGAAIGAYIGLNVAAIITGILLGLQPIIAKSPSGEPLYAPYPLVLAVPAMAIEHLLVFGFVEAIITAMVVAYIQRTDSSMMYLASIASGPQKETV